MTGSQVIETAIGLALLFFLLATAVTAVTELIAQIFNLRGKKLKKALRHLFGGSSDRATAKKLEKAFRSSPIIADLQGTYLRFIKRKPTYIAPEDFAIGLLDTVQRFDPASGRLADTQTVEWQSALDALPSSLQQRLRVIAADAAATVGSSHAALRKGIERWFDNAMGRVEGWYRRQSRWIVMLVGAALTVGLGIDAVDVTERLWESPVVREAGAEAAATLVLREAEAVAAVAAEAAETGADEALDTSRLDEAFDNVRALDGLGIPIGWPDEFEWGDTPEKAVTALWDAIKADAVKIVGLLLSIFLVSLGAPFWFDVLSRLSSLRSAGSKPAAAADLATAPPGGRIGPMAAGPPRGSPEATVYAGLMDALLSRNGDERPPQSDEAKTEPDNAEEAAGGEATAPAAAVPAAEPSDTAVEVDATAATPEAADVTDVTHHPVASPPPRSYPPPPTDGTWVPETGGPVPFTPPPPSGLPPEPREGPGVSEAAAHEERPDPHERPPEPPTEELP